MDTNAIFVLIPTLIALYLMPGLAVIRLFWRSPRSSLFSLSMILALAVGISVCLPPVLLLLSSYVGLPWNSAMTWGYVAVATVIAFFPHLHRIPEAQEIPRYRRDPYQDPRHPQGPHQGPHRYRWEASPLWQHVRSISPLLSLTDLALFGITVAALGVRLFLVRDLPTGLFGDSYHHTMMAQLLVEKGGIFQSWQPYAPLASFTYHFGFHANSSFVHWLSGIEMTTCVVLVGQWFNALAAPMAFLLITTLSGQPWAGVWAAFGTAFVSSIPAFYVNWGRYTQLTGHIVLVVVVVCWTTLVVDHLPLRPLNRLWRQLAGQWRAILLVGVMTASMILTHYLVTVFAALFVGSYLLVLILMRQSWRTVIALILQALPIIIITLIITSGWLINLSNGYLVRNATGFVNGYTSAERIANYATIPPIAPLYMKRSLIALAVGGLCIALWRRQWRVTLLGLWTVLLVLCVVPHLIGFPGSGMIDYLTGLGAWYITIVPLAGYALAAVQDGLFGLFHLSSRTLSPSVKPSAFMVVHHVVVSLLLAGGVWWGVVDQLDLIDGSTQMVTHADMRAMEWIRDDEASEASHIPPDARFFVNGFPAYGGTLIAGTDAGWWIPLLTRRESILPPLTYGSEVGEEPGYQLKLNAQYEQIRGKPLYDSTSVRLDLTTPAAVEVLREEGITHIYSGAHATPDTAHADHIDTDILRESDLFTLVYDEQGVEIFAFIEHTDQTE